jgi:hypothetical protein
VQEQDSPATRTLNLLGAILGLIYLLWAMWTLMVPEPTRREWKLRAALSCARGMRMLGRHAAAGSLSREVTTGQANYELPYALMTASEWFSRQYERMLP